MGTMEINEFNQEKLRLLDTEHLLAFYGIFGTLNSPRAKEMVAGISRELKRRNYALDEESEIDVKALLKGLGKGAKAAGKILKTAIKVTYPIAKDMVKGTWIISKKIGGAIGDLMDDAEFRKLFTKYIDNPEDPNRLKKIQAYTDSMLSDAPVSGMESVKMKKLRIEKVCSIVLGEDFNKDFIYEDVDFTKPSAIKKAYKIFESTDLEESATAQRKLKTYNKLSSAEYEKFSKLKAFNDKDWKWNSKEGLYHRVKESTDLEEAKRMKYATVIKKLKDGEWDTSMDVKQRMHLTYTDNNTGKTQVVFVESDELDEAPTDKYMWKDINKALMSAGIRAGNILKVLKALRGRAIEESVELEEAKKVIAQVELWNGKKIKKSFKDQSSAEKFIKNLQDTEDVRGYNMYAEGLEEAPTDKYMPKDISMALRSAGIGTANVMKVRKLFKGSTADDRYTMKDINLALMSVIGSRNIKKVIKALRGRAVKEADDLEEKTVRRGNVTVSSHSYGVKISVGSKYVVLSPEEADGVLEYIETKRAVRSAGFSIMNDKMNRGIRINVSGGFAMLRPIEVAAFLEYNGFSDSKIQKALSGISLKLEAVDLTLRNI